ncbi:ATP-binding cassette domain-containing protein [Paenibacillus sp. FSL H7-0716]|uniref:ABC transporter ATP-binding protein n=1 Tax=Paenibacillus odorifer TaxID=189426 RepID=A0A1R0YPB4_9BACL|nr:ATP-binding cassette domain-containing protein [Paenibacillus odorifer]AWV31164.1 ABC transporter ATP-binding protein [Paenibacillus odorifer]OME06680.1 ABC transporter ATP-binding protein [Paenibacillus odorifer]OME09587.1 ABC transporter ATP-binding protein [Paenibacillus odorifer]
MELALQIKDLTVHYGGFTALDRINLNLEQHTTLGLVGESGSGKSTLARVIAGLIAPNEGQILLGTQELKKKRSREQHKTIQMIFQNPDASLNPKHSIRQILSEPLLFHKIVGRAGVEQRCKELLNQVHLEEKALDKFPHEFSGGQRQRIAIARALSVEPSILIADEPTSALDVSVQLSVLELFNTLKAELNLTMLFISHDLGVINAISDTVAVMRQGKLVEQSPRDQFFIRPKHKYSYELLSAVPKMPK